MTRTLLIDGGQSGCRVALLVDGAVAERATAPGLTRVGRDYGGLRELRARYAPDVAAAGLTGYDGGEIAGLDVVSNDAVTAHLGALGGEPGAVIVAGTGAIGLAATAEGWARADGWGTLLGDDGGGYWIGRRALALALRAHDGRGDAGALRTAAEARFGPLAQVARAVYDAPDPVATIAAFTRGVAEVARGGHPAAAALWHEAGHELARTTAAALARLASAGGEASRGEAARASGGRTARGGGAPVAVSWSGGVFAAGDLLLEPFRAELARLWPSADVRAPLGDGLDGAARLLDAPALFADLIHGAP